MRIAILSPFYPYRGGISQFSAMLYTALAKDNNVKAFTFSLLYPDFLFPGKTQYVEKGDSAQPIPAERTLNSINPLSYRKTANQIKAYQPDLLIISYWMSFFVPAYSEVARLVGKKTKIITLIHNAIPHEPKFFDKPFARYFFRENDGFIVMSDIVRDDLLKLKPDARYILKEHPLYNHFGQKIEKQKALASLALQTDKKTLLFFGLIRDYKGLDLLIEAMRELDDSFQLLIAGESYGSFEKYERLIAESPAKERIRSIVEYINDAQVPILFSAADLLVLPYKSATQSGVIPVAYHFEVPVLVTNVGGLKDGILERKTGLVCAPNPGSIAEGVRELFKNGTDDFIGKIRQEKEKLSWDKFADAVLEFADTLRR